MIQVKFDVDFEIKIFPFGYLGHKVFQQLIDHYQQLFVYSCILFIFIFLLYLYSDNQNSSMIIDENKPMKFTETNDSQISEVCFDLIFKKKQFFSVYK
jgi:hypothetical protein